MTTICFQLTMPNSNSWNGKWSGDGVFYARTRSIKDEKKVETILSRGSYYYNFGDGWGASVQVKKVTPAEKRKIDKNTKGFCGYEWMIDSIINWGGIYAEKPESENIK